MNSNQTYQAVFKLREYLRDIVREWGLMQSYPCIPELTLSQGHALIEVELHQRITIAELAKVLNLDHSSVSRLVARLAKKQYIQCTTKKHDSRAKVLKLSSLGRSVLQKLNRQCDSRVITSFALLNKVQQNEVLSGLEHYSQALKRVRKLDEFNLRPIRQLDNKAMAAVIRQVMPEFGADGPGFAIHDKEVDSLYQAYSGTRHAYFVIEINSKVVGGGGVGPLVGGKPDTCELRKMYLLSEARGFGLGEKLLRQCLISARSLGFKSCYLETTTKMLQAQALYKKLGFKPLRRPKGATGHCGCDKWYELKLK